MRQNRSTNPTPAEVAEKGHALVVVAEGAGEDLLGQSAEVKEWAINRSSRMIFDTSYFYFRLVLGCIDADLCK